jgi:hypothetical protein
MNTLRIFLFVFLGAFVLTGCQDPTVEQVKTAVTVRDLDDELKDVLTGELLHERDPVAAAPSFETVLVDIAERASDEAGKAKDQNLKISFYRIAAVAAWKAGTAGEPLIVDMTGAGKAACDAAVSKPPRDCAVIDLALPYAAMENEVRKLQYLQHKRKLEESEDGDFDAALKIVDRMSDSVEDLLRIRGEVRELAAPPELFIYMDAQHTTAYCWLRKANTFAIDIAPLTTDGSNPTRDSEARAKEVVIKTDQVLGDQDCAKFLAET